jgi:Rrf2 family protein
MKRDSRLSGALHALLHMGEAAAPMTSDQLAICLHTNPVVVRRTMAGLREAGLVTSERGHGGGWRLARALSDITLRDVHAALGEPALTPEAPPVESSGCLVEAAVNRSLETAYAEARALIEARLAQVTLADLAADFADRKAQLNIGGSHGSDHAA